MARVTGKAGLGGTLLGRGGYVLRKSFIEEVTLVM